MPDFTPLGMLIVFVITLVAGLGWSLGCWIVTTLLGALRRGPG